MGGVCTSSSDGNDLRTLKMMGDEHFKQRQFDIAIFFYTSAISKYIETPDRLGGLGADDGRLYFFVNDNEDVESVDKSLFATLYGDRSAAYFLTGGYQNSAEDASRATEIDPLYAKGYYRAAKALIQIPGREMEAMECIEKGMAVVSVNDKGLINLFADLKDIALKSEASRGRGNGWVYSWGLGHSGQLGHGEDKDRINPVLIERMRGKHVADVACGAAHSMAVLGTGEVVTWGDNSRCQLGITSVEAHINVPMIIPGLMGLRITAVSCGEAHTIAITDDGRAYSWGAGASLIHMQLY